MGETYAKDSKATLKMQVYDAYIKFFRWATDRLQDRNGIVCFVSNNGFLEGVAFDGFRRHLAQDFDFIYHFDLKGNARMSGERRRQEGGNIFSDQIRVGIGITVLVRTKGGEQTRIYYHTVDDYWKAEQKKEYLSSFHKLSNVDWKELQPDNRHTWLVPEHAGEFEALLPIARKDTKTVYGVEEAIFKMISLGVSTSRDEWIYDYSADKLTEKMRRHIQNYNYEVFRFSQEGKRPASVDDFVNNDPAFIKWTDRLKTALESGQALNLDLGKIRNALYRPFVKQKLYFDPFTCSQKVSTASVVSNTGK